jgi:hypothetical protein
LKIGQQYTNSNPVSLFLNREIQKIKKASWSKYAPTITKPETVSKIAKNKTIIARIEHVDNHKFNQKPSGTGAKKIRKYYRRAF